jgi:hypothetical protein
MIAKSKKTKTKREAPCSIWDAFLRISEPNTADEVPVAEPGVLEVKGAPEVLKLLRNEVLPLVRKLSAVRTNLVSDQISGYFFLVHNRESGVPTTREDKGAYIHLRLYFYYLNKRARVEQILGDKWEMLTPIRLESSEIAGIDKKHLRDGSVDVIRDILKKQSELAMQIINAYTDDVDPLVMIGQVRQNLHYLANMFQMKSVG